jgi:hypothetical protein
MTVLPDAIELAKITMPEMYRDNGHKKPWFFQRLFQQKPGAKPKLAEVTYKGKTQIQAFLGKHGEFREDAVSFETYDRMRVNPWVKLATIMRAAPIHTALRETRIECEDPRIAAFIKKVFVDELLLQLADTSIAPSYMFGLAPHEKVWVNKHVKAAFTDDEGNEIVAWDGPALVYDKIKYVHPVSLKPDGMTVSPKDGSFISFEQKTLPDEKPRIVESWKAFMFIQNFIFAGLWGEAEYRGAYAYWYYEEFFRALQADHLRFKAIPPVVGHAPKGTQTDQDGNEVDNLIHAGKILQAAYENLVVILPYEPDERGKQQWGYNELQTSDAPSELFTRAIEELGVQILRVMLVPERTVTQNRAAVGSYNQADVHQERMLDASKREVDHFLIACNKWCVPQLVEDHFGPAAPPCTLRTNAVSEDMKMKLNNIVLTILQNDREGRFANQVAFIELLDFLDIPFTTTQNGLLQSVGEENNDEEGEE